MKSFKQLFQNLENGQTEFYDIPYPQLKKGHLIIQSQKSLISAGTERMLVEFGQSNILDKIKSQPDKVKQVIEKIKTDGLLETMDAVKSKLSDPLPMGYSNCGVVLKVSKDIDPSEFKPGDRVLSNGPHAQIFSAPKNLCTRIPSEVSDEEAAFTVIASIALHGIRLSKPELGETFVVLGLGLIGLIAVQLLKQNGVGVIGLDYNKDRLKLAEQFGATPLNLNDADDPQAFVHGLTNGHGADGVLICAATKSNDPIELSPELCRKRGRIILVGVSKLNLNRTQFYHKEITFQVSCSYGPGRYDPQYEGQGIDYPISHVRFTENRNFQTILNLIEQDKLQFKNFITHEYDFQNAGKAYELITQNKEPYCGILLNYPKDSELEQKSYSQTIQTNTDVSTEDDTQCAMIGAGHFSKRILLPLFKKQNAVLKTIVSQNGINSAIQAKKFGFLEASTEPEKIFTDPKINCVIIASRHDTHFEFVKKALQNNQHVFVEKPLCLTLSELEEIKIIYDSYQKNANKPYLFVGFNRRFSPYTQMIKNCLDPIKEPKCLTMHVNAGFIPKDHWIQNHSIGGGRIIGEGCHFIDLLSYLTKEKIETIKSFPVKNPNQPDSVTIQLEFSQGSIGTIHYFTNGSKSYPKEQLHIFTQGKVIELSNFRKLKTYGFRKNISKSSFSLKKGHAEEIQHFFDVIKGNQTPIPFGEFYHASKMAILAEESKTSL